MKIHVNRVPETGVSNRASYDPSTMDMERPDIHLREPFDVEAFMALAEKELVVRAGIHCPLVMTCARCLEEFPSTIRSDAVFSYTVQPTDVVDITEDLRQEIILAYPMVPLCRPECKGLCRSCGQNLNTASCSHHAAVPGGGTGTADIGRQHTTKD